MRYIQGKLEIRDGLARSLRHLLSMFAAWRKSHSEVALFRAKCIVVANWYQAEKELYALRGSANGCDTMGLTETMITQRTAKTKREQLIDEISYHQNLVRQTGSCDSYDSAREVHPIFFTLLQILTFAMPRILIFLCLTSFPFSSLLRRAIGQRLS